jgi:undecaprenyl-diphosphatase
MKIFEPILLGIVQGLTEFFPVSSSGHLVIIPFIFKWDYIPVYYTVILHFATLLALITVFFKEIIIIIKSFFIGIFRKSVRKEKNFKLAILIIIASIPAALVGFLFDKYIESFFSRPLFVGIFLLITAAILIIGELRGNFTQKNRYSGNNNLKTENLHSSPDNQNSIMESNINTEKPQINYLIAFIVGIGQAIAVLPGISRSGITISFSRFFGIKREECVRFSFLLSIPVILGSFLFEFYKSHSVIISSSFQELIYLLISFVFAYASGFFAIKFMVKFSKNRNLNIFAIYCIVIAIIIFILIAIKGF